MAANEGNQSGRIRGGACLMPKSAQEAAWAANHATKPKNIVVIIKLSKLHMQLSNLRPVVYSGHGFSLKSGLP
jgi:hypothetical protein